MTEDFRVEIPIVRDGNIETAILECSRRTWLENGVLSDRFFVKCSAPGIQVDAWGHNYFHALMEIREQLEPDGWRLLCYGASRNFWTSGMSLQMSGGRRGYKFQRGRPVSVNDIVDVFGTGPDVIPATIAEQRQFIGLDSSGIGPPAGSV